MYHAQLGRFVSRDPAGYGAGDFEPYRYVLNNPTNAVDPDGDVSVMVTFGAFIGGWRGAWLHQPHLPYVYRFDWWYRTDQRGYGGGSYRLAGRILFDTDNIGRITTSNSNGYVFTGTSVRRRRSGTGWVYETAKAIPKGAVAFKNLSPCHTVWKVWASAGYPFIPGTNVLTRLISLWKSTPFPCSVGVR